MDFRPGELVAVRAGSHWPELVGRIQMIMPRASPFGWAESSPSTYSQFSKGLGAR